LPLPTTGETIAIRYGERLYYRVGTAKTAQELNAMYGVSEAQAKAMLASLLAEWETPPVSSEHYDPFVSQNPENVSKSPEPN
jgi:hypothetical protein